MTPMVGLERALMSESNGQEKVYLEKEKHLVSMKRMQQQVMRNVSSWVMSEVIKASKTAWL